MKRDLKKHGYTKGCIACDTIRAGQPRAGVHHSERCRQRLEEALKAEGSARLEQHEERVTERMARQFEEDDRRRKVVEAPRPDEVPGKRPRVGGPDDAPDEHMGDPETNVSYLLNVHREAYIQEVQHTEDDYPVCEENYTWGGRTRGRVRARIHLERVGCCIWARPRP